MAATSVASNKDVIAKTHSSNLEDQAATAALYLPSNERSTGEESAVNGQRYLDKDRKLSSAGKVHLRNL